MHKEFYKPLFLQSIDKLHSEKRYRKFVQVSRHCEDFPYAIINGKKALSFCSNDYLGMGQRLETVRLAVSATKTYGVGSGGTRNISGTSLAIVGLEQEIANLHKKESAIVFTSGYVANDAAIQTLAQIIPNLIIFSDEKNHASIIAGARNSRLEKKIFRHNDITHLEELVSSYNQAIPKLIIFESVYSMDGDFGKIQEISAIAKKYNCLTYIDEVHSVGLYGNTGAGLCEMLGEEKNIDIIQGTLAKAYGCMGGYIASDKEIIDAIRLNASGFIFTTSLPPAICIAARENIKYLKTSEKERILLKKRVDFLKKELSFAKINFIENQSHIVSILVGSAKKAEEISVKLLNEFNIYAQHINYPTVARGDERLRITTTPAHSEKMIKTLVEALKICFSDF
jgi:5-aminolevulinate synthase